MTLNLRLTGRSRFVLLLVLIIIMMISCKRDFDKPENPPLITNDEEIITTFSITFQDSSSIQPEQTFRFMDIDGDGGNPPNVFDTIRLQSHSVYFASILLLNETLFPVDTISNEVLNEGVNHLFCFNHTGVSLEIIRTDTDGNYEIGLASKWTTNEVGEGFVTITLRHQPGIKNGSCDPGDTDIEISFPYIIN